VRLAVLDRHIMGTVGAGTGHKSESTSIATRRDLHGQSYCSGKTSERQAEAHGREKQVGLAASGKPSCLLAHVIILSSCLSMLLKNAYITSTMTRLFVISRSIHVAISQHQEQGHEIDIAYFRVRLVKVTAVPRLGSLKQPRPSFRVVHDMRGPKIESCPTLVSDRHAAFD
jgi:hypothetical protein